MNKTALLSNQPFPITMISTIPLKIGNNLMPSKFRISLLDKCQPKYAKKMQSAKV